MNKSSLQGCIIMLLGLNLSAQSDINEMKKRYPGYSELIIKESQTYSFSIQDKKPSILQDNYFESVILSENGIHNNAENLSFSQLVPLKSYEGFTSVKIDGKEKKIPVKEISYVAESSGSVFHSDVKSKKLLFTNLDIGAKKIYSYQSEFLDPFLLHKFVFSGHIPVEESILEISVDKDMEIGYKIFNNVANDIEFSQTSKRKKNIYRWTRKNGKPLKFESNHPGVLHIAPHIMVYIRSYKLDDKSVPVLGNVGNLYNYYKNFVSAINKKDDAELAETSKKITTNLNTDEEKIKAIYYWVKDHIKYVAFEYGYEGFIPREASLVYQRKFGDCKDMSSIITTMARYASIKDVNLCWIGTRRLPYTYADVATPGVDDHMIASITLDGKTIFLDATDTETRYGLPTGFIQGKEALIQRGDSFSIEKVPVVSPEMNLQQEHIRIHTQQNTIHGKASYQTHGLSRSDVLHSLGDATKEKRFNKIKDLLLKGNNKFKLKEFKEENIRERDLPYRIDYSFTLENFMVSTGKQSFISLMLVKPFEKNIIEQNRESKYDFDNLTQYKYTIELEIPQSKVVNNVPQNISESNDLIDYKISYTLQDKTVILEMDLKNKKLMLEKEDFETWNESIKKLKAKYQETIVLADRS
jgi:transglutaminase-like putative cysteine protease